MTVVHLMSGKWHDLGWELSRLMKADNVRASSQQEFGDRLTKEGGYPIGQQLISDYMRVRVVKDEDGNEQRVPRAYPPMEFIAAVIMTFNLTEKQAENLAGAWLNILPERRHVAVLALVDTLRNTSHPVEAWREMLAFEEELVEESEEVKGGSKASRKAS